MAIFAMVKPLILFKPVLGAGAFYSIMVGVEATVIMLMLCVSIPLATLQYRNIKLRKKVNEAAAIKR